MMKRRVIMKEAPVPAKVLGSKRMKIEAPMPEKLCGTRPSFKSVTALGMVQTLVNMRKDDNESLRSVCRQVADLKEQPQMHVDVRQIKRDLVSTEPTNGKNQREEESKSVEVKDDNKLDVEQINMEPTCSKNLREIKVKNVHSDFKGNILKTETTPTSKENVESVVMKDMGHSTSDNTVQSTPDIMNKLNVIEKSMFIKLRLLAKHQMDTMSKMEVLNEKMDNTISKLGNVEEMCTSVSNRFNTSMLEMTKMMKDLQESVTSTVAKAVEKNAGGQGRMQDGYSPRFNRRSWNHPPPHTYSPSPHRFCDRTFSEWSNEFVSQSEGYQNKFIDTHCHIDHIYQKYGYHMSYSQFKFDHRASWPVNYEGCVAVFCRPSTFVDERAEGRLILNMLLQDKEPGVWFTFGCHPRNATEFTSDHKESLFRLLTATPNVVALGEIGLDYASIHNQHKDEQKEVFTAQLQMAVELNLPLVIHCRDADEDCLDILQKNVPRKHKIHIHCFSQNWEMAQRWMSLFPNLYIGLTPLISYKSALDPIDTAKHIPLNKLLLETDAPHFLPGGGVPWQSSLQGGGPPPHPGLALFTAQMVARYQGVEVDEVLRACRENTRAMYGI